MCTCALLQTEGSEQGVEAAPRPNVRDQLPDGGVVRAGAVAQAPGQHDGDAVRTLCAREAETAGLCTVVYVQECESG